MTKLWPSATIGQVTTLVDSLHKTPPAYALTGYPMIRVTDIRRGYATTIGAVRVDESTFEEFSKKHKPTTGDILFSRVGSYGNSAFVKNMEPFCLGQNTVCISPKRSVIEPFYLYSFLNSPLASQQIEAYVGGASQPTISLQNIASIVVPLPPLPAQRRIAAILSAYDDLIENNTRCIAILEEMARRIYEEWFVNFRFPGHEKVRMVESELGLIPVGWEVVSLSTCVDTQYGFTESAQDKNVGPKFLRGMDINKQSFIDWASVPYCRIPKDDYPKFKLRAGDIVVIRMADPGKVGIVEQDVEAVFASYLVRLRIKNPRLSPYLLFYFLNSERYQGYITGVSTGTTRKSASAPLIVGIDMVLSPTSVTAQFNDQVSLLRRQINLLLRTNTNLRAQRDLLLPKLISGEIDVADFPELEAVAA